MAPPGLDDWLASEGQNRLLRAIEEVAFTSFASMPTSAIMERLAGIIGEALGAQIVVVRQYHPHRQVLETIASWGIPLSEYPFPAVPAERDLSGRIFSVQDTVVVYAADHPDDATIRTLRERLGIETGVAVPLRAGDAYIGCLRIMFTQRRSFLPEEMALVQAVADRLALALHHAQALEREQEARRQAEALLLVAQAGLADAPLNQVLKGLAHHICQALGADRTVIRLWNEAEQALDLVAFAPALLSGTLVPRHPIGKSTFSMRLFQERHTISLPDISLDPVARTTFHPAIVSTCGTPIPDGEQPLGVIHADWTTPHTPTPQEQALLEMAARLAGQAILKARTLEQEREARRWSEALAKVLQAGTRPGPLPHILQDILESMGNYWQAPGGIIRLLDRATNNLVAVACIGFDLADLPPQPVDGTGGGFSHLIFRERRVGAFGYEELVRAGSFVPRFGYRFMVGTPLEMQGQPIGVVHLDWKEERPFTQEDLQRFDLMVRTACQAVERAWLYEEAERRARALAEANQALNLQAAILNQVSEAVAATDTEGRLCYWGPGAERLTGVPSHQALGQPAYALLGGTEAMWAECVHKVLEGGESTAIRTFQAALPNGKCAWLEVVLSPWYEEGGHLKGFILVARDITNIRQMEVQLLQLEKMRALGQMAAGVAHDFNNFLAVIMGQAELSLMDQALLPRHRRALEAIRRASADGAQVVRRLATLARMRAEGQAEPVDVCKVCHEALDSTRFAWEERAARQGITITTSLDLQDVPPASCTESELREVLINLILNGIDAMPKGGVLTISCFQEEERVCIAVKDTGTGIPPEVRTHLFEPFFTTKGARGTGLGLAVSYSIVKRYGGDIEVNTKVGEGSTFTVSLPIAQVPQEQGKHRGGRPTTTRSLHLLVVDDDPAVADLLRDLLASMGHRPEVFQDPAKALEAFTAQEWDGVITDLSMPDLTGWEVAAYIKKARPSVPVLLLTGYGDHIDLQEARARGVDGVLGKPISIEDLASAFLALVEGGGKAVPLVQEGKHPKIGRYYPFR